MNDDGWGVEGSGQFFWGAVMTVADALFIAACIFAAVFCG